jgi:hypothetical protein
MSRSRQELSLFAAAMIRLRAVLAPSMVLVSLAGCGPSANTPGPSVPLKSDVIVTLDGEHHTCIVALHSEPQGSTVSCADVVPFVRDELRLASGSIYDMRTIAKVDDAERAKVESSLKAAGYRAASSQ